MKKGKEKIKKCIFLGYKLKKFFRPPLPGNDQNAEYIFLGDFDLGGWLASPLLCLADSQDPLDQWPWKPFLSLNYKKRGFYRGVLSSTNRNAQYINLQLILSCRYSVHLEGDVIFFPYWQICFGFIMKYCTNLIWSTCSPIPCLLFLSGFFFFFFIFLVFPSLLIGSGLISGSSATSSDYSVKTITWSLWSD